MSDEATLEPTAEQLAAIEQGPEGLPTASTPRKVMASEHSRVRPGEWRELHRRARRARDRRDGGALHGDVGERAQQPGALLAQAVIRGDYGNGEERRLRLGSLYDAVQARVNEILL